MRLRGCCAAVSLSNACFLVHGPCGLNFHFQCNEIGGSLPHTGRFRATCTATGSRFTRNLLRIPSRPRRVKFSPVNFPPTNPLRTVKMPSAQTNTGAFASR